jgi:hypothetical protein
LTAEEIGRRMRVSTKKVERRLRTLMDAHLVREVPGPVPRYELTHDFLMDLVLQSTRDLQDRRLRANRVLHRALEDTALNPWHTMSLADCYVTSVHGDAVPGARRLIRRSLLFGFLRWFVAFPAVVAAGLALIYFNSGKVSLERDYADRIVIRRLVGDAVVLDTGFHYADLKKERVKELNGHFHCEWDHRQSGVMEQPLFFESLRLTDLERAKLLCQMGEVGQGLTLLQNVIERAPGSRDQAYQDLSRAALVDPAQAGRALQPLIAAPRRELDAWLTAMETASPEAKKVSRAWVSDHLKPLGSLGFALRADSALAHRFCEALLRVLRDKSYANRANVLWALGMVLRWDTRFAHRSLEPLLFALDDEDRGVRFASAWALGKAVQADHALAVRIVEPLCIALSDRYVPQPLTTPRLLLPAAHVRSASAWALGMVGHAKPELSGRVIDALLVALKDNDYEVMAAAAEALGLALQSRRALDRRVYEALFPYLRDVDSLIVHLPDLGPGSPRTSMEVEALAIALRFDAAARARAFSLLTGHDESLRRRLRVPLLKALVGLAGNEQDPAQFLLDHLHGSRSELPGGDANTDAVYRDVVTGAIARWMSLGEPERSRMEERLRPLRQGRLVHLRIAAWNAFVEAAELEAFGWESVDSGF